MSKVSTKSFVLTVILSIAEMPRVIFSPESLGIIKTKREITWRRSKQIVVFTLISHERRDLVISNLKLGIISEKY